MALLFIQNNLYYSCEILHADGRCFSHIFTGSPKMAREAALTSMLEFVLNDAVKEDAFCTVSVHHIKTGEKVTVTSTALLREPHTGLEMELELWEREKLNCDKILFTYAQPDSITLLHAKVNTDLLKRENHILGIAYDWTVTFGRRKTRLNVAA